MGDSPTSCGEGPDSPRGDGHALPSFPRKRESSIGEDPGPRAEDWIPACAGMTEGKDDGVAPSPESNHAPQFSWPEGRQMALSLSFDDGRESQWRHALPLLDRYGVRATFYPLPSAVREHVESWRAVVTAGHEIGNHSATHPCSGNFRFSRRNALEEMTLDALEQGELLEANRQLLELLGVQPRTFAYPCGQTTVGRGKSVQSYVPAVARHFLAGRLFFSEMHNDPAYCDLHQLYAVTMDNVDEAGLDALLDAARAEGGWLILAGHDAGPVGARQTTLLDTLEHLCRRAAVPDNSIWLDTVVRIAEYVRDARTARGQT